MNSLEDKVPTIELSKSTRCRKVADEFGIEKPQIQSIV